MNPDRERILKMVAEGKLSVKEAENLLDALLKAGSSDEPAMEPVPETKKKGAPKYLFVKVISSSEDNVDVRIPLGLLRAGMKLTSLIPPHVLSHITSHMGEKGISLDFNNLKKEDIEELIENLAEMEVNVNSKSGDRVRVYCE